MAWKASSASWWLRRTRRQTPQTIGPCRRTRAASAASSRRLRKSSSSCPSVRSALLPARTARRRHSIRLTVPSFATPASCLRPPTLYPTITGSASFSLVFLLGGSPSRILGRQADRRRHGWLLASPRLDAGCFRPATTTIGNAKWMAPSLRWAPTPRRSTPMSSAKVWRMRSASPGFGKDRARSSSSGTSSL